MAKATSRFVCQNCGDASTKWSGKCDACGAWNTLVEERLGSSGIGAAPGQRPAKGEKFGLVGLDGEDTPLPRSTTGIAEFDRVTGGGIVPGSAILVGGDPGIGKSTLLLQVTARIAERHGTAIYVSGEEAIAQVRMRAKRLGLQNSGVLLAAETNIADIITTIRDTNTPCVLIIDSIQTMWSPSIEAAPGSVSQVRQTAQTLIHHAKSTNSAVILVGHVTKEGQIAGPRVIEHMVDTVLYFEGERGHQFRILRSVKNRFGPTDEIGVFEMTGEGLQEVDNPSKLFLGERDLETPGAAVFAGIEGTRPVLVEIQALVATSTLGTPRRAVVGWDQARLSMILAVLDAHCGLSFAGQDVYLNVAGGLKIREPACDLAVAAALVSSLSGKTLPRETVYFGEVSLSGGLRTATQTNARLREAEKLGFKTAVTAPRGDSLAPDTKEAEISLRSHTNLVDLVSSIVAPANRGD